MNNTLSKFVIFAAGAVIGSAVTWKILDEKYKTFAQEQIDSVKKALLDDDFDPNEYVPSNRTDVKENYENIIDENKYTNYSNNIKKEEDGMEKPYIITPEEFGEYEDDYTTVSLWYHSDGILTDDNNDIVDDIDEIVGEESLTHFGDYEDDSVFVRNDRTKCDYEILFVDEPYYDTEN